MNTIVERLRELRTECNLTQREIARQLEITQSGYLRWEKGITEPNIESIKKLCKIFDVSADYLIGLENDYGAKTIQQTNNITHKEQEWLNFYRKLPPDSLERLITVFKAVLPEEEKDLDRLRKI